MLFMKYPMFQLVYISVDSFFSKLEGMRHAIYSTPNVELLDSVQFYHSLSLSLSIALCPHLFLCDIE